MKMPWSFLIRRRTKDPSPSEITDVKEASNTVHKTDDLADKPANLEEASEPSVPTTNVDVDATRLAKQAAKIPDARPTTASRSRPNLPRSRQKRGTLAASPIGGPLTASKAKKQKMGSSVSEPTPTVASFSGASVLDEEIKLLRRQLADKLRLQNAQLEEMLRRFGAS
ncbi:hypothetical protein HFO93_20405 [Rhizobium leguminosarum]|uniref:hypothetical protein n=1 Tax=Rhizobium leguminosarum TaxID=384 RepID=UPI001C9689A9|nr:hypothetical protein [Rhizobium leguminosarum]MBY5445800.1 hypothetical protein [Rhizobium leguminosarum]